MHGLKAEETHEVEMDRECTYVLLCQVTEVV